MTPSTHKTSKVLIIVAFAIVYVVWGSTYFFIQMAIHGFPPLIMGALRFLLAGIFMLTWCIIRGEKVWVMKYNKHSAISGVIMLFGGNGALIWAETTVPSAVAAILVSAAPIWFVLLDKSHWGINFKNTFTIAGLVVGFAGVILLFGEQLSGVFGSDSLAQLPNMAILVGGSILWAGGSLYSKYKAGGNNSTVSTTWQMLAAGIAFIPFAFLHNEFDGFSFSAVPASAWYAVAYLVVFGSIIAFSAYVWLLKVRSATQVSTYAYVNPVIAIILGVAFAGEHISLLQILGLVIILGSVLLINWTKYSKARKEEKEIATV